MSRGFVAQLLDASGAPVSNAQVSWFIKSGPGPTLGAAATVTDSEGKTGTLFFAEQLLSGVHTKPITLTASTNFQGVVRSLDFTALTVSTSVGVSAELTTSLSLVSGLPTTIGAGTVLPNAFTARIFVNLPGAGPAPLAGVGLIVDPDGKDGPVASCVTTAVSDASGLVVCALAAGGRIANGSIKVSVGGLTDGGFTSWVYALRIAGGPPANLRIVSGDGQSGVSGDVTARALLVEGRDAYGNPSELVEPTWTVVSGSGQLTGISGAFNREGQASALIRFGEVAGPIVVEVRHRAAAVRFNLRNDSAPGTFSALSGGGQSAGTLTEFGQPLVVRALDGRGQPVIGSTVSFAVTGGDVTLSSPAATTNSQGQASVRVTAGANGGPATVQATLGSSRVTFDLTVLGVLPKFDSLSTPQVRVPAARPARSRS
ncbi:MAG: Ig-like domain-containing protein [Bryobacteraceae bacterium]|nr:Ig-like domain-containing protein [Bryobacteraceae bacterium]